MTVIRRLAALGVVASLAMVLHSARSDAQEDSRARARAGVVMIQARSANGTSAGAGIVVATSGQDIYVVTAYHVLRGATTVQVQVLTRPGEWFAGRVLDLRDPDLDLGAVAVTLPAAVNVSTLRGAGGASATLLLRGAEVFPLGFPAGRTWSMPVAADRVANTTTNRVIFQSNFTRPGNSGGPLLDSCGRVSGMVVVADPPEAEAIRIETILEAVRNWRLPGPLLLTPSTTSCGSSNDPPPPPSTCEVSLSSTPTGATVYLDDRQQGTTARTVTLRRGQRYDVRLERDGFKPFEQQIDCGNSSVRATLEPATTDVTLVYSGDQFGCSVQIAVKIGDRTAVPQGNVYVISDVPLGRQQYSITGQIGCAAIGQCRAQGQGSVNVSPDSTFNVMWQNTTFAQCSVSLARR